MHLHHFVGRRSSLCLPEKLDWGELGKFNHSVLRKELAQIVNLNREGLCKLEYFLVWCLVSVVVEMRLVPFLFDDSAYNGVFSICLWTTCKLDFDFCLARPMFDKLAKFLGSSKMLRTIRSAL
jgi:hypothetical protein